jgi:tRNA dimethylallyltransferase
VNAIFLLGPTASGKTALALQLFDRLPLEIISVDSALVYRDMNIGTAKPDAETLGRYPHHLIDVIDPTEAYSAARFRNDALALMAEASTRGRVPLLVGGTMLYAKALVEGLSALPLADAAIREALDQRAQTEGWPALHAELARIDPATAARLNPADRQRIQRALEVFQLTGMPMSALQNRRADASGFPYRYLTIGLVPSERAVLHQRIAARFDAMLAAGLVDEVVALRERYRLQPDMPSMRAVGYRQAWQFLDGDIDRAALRDAGVAATRQLAKRQLTWLRSMPHVENIDCLQADVADAVLNRVKVFLAGAA